MTTTQLEQALIEYSKGLPKEALEEILDFIQFIRQKKMKVPFENLTYELKSLSQSESKHLEEEFKDYKDLYPNEGLGMLLILSPAPPSA